MLNTQQIGGSLKSKGYEFYSGVPCSFLKDLINYAINECNFVMAANEGDAVAIAAGAYLGGTKSVVFMQNSGLTNAVSPLTSLNAIFRLPVLGFVSLRGEAGLQDEPQHELMGQITAQMLEVMKIKWEYLSADQKEAAAQIDAADRLIEKGESFFFIVKKNTFEKVSLKPQTERIRSGSRKVVIGEAPLTKPSRIEALGKLIQIRDDRTVFIASTGFNGRELYELGDNPNNFYMVGSMGCASSIGLGISLCQPGKDVVAIDGDGALLMRLGAMATNGYYSPKGMLHILFDNNAHESTGGQMTVSGNVDFAGVAEACGYSRVVQANDLNEFEAAVQDWKMDKALTFISLKTRQGVKEDLARPKVKPYEVKERLMKFIGGGK